jgi:MFS family permease
VYEWLVLVHILGVLGFMFTHGVAAAMALRLRHERNPDRVRVMLQISSSSLSVFYVSILLLLGGGVWAGFNGHWWDQGWIWVALGVFIANLIFMYAVPTPYYKKVREVMTIEESGSSAVGPERLDAMLRSNLPIVTLVVGLVSIAFIAYLMVIKPF